MLSYVNGHVLGRWLHSLWETITEVPGRADCLRGRYNPNRPGFFSPWPSWINSCWSLRGAQLPSVPTNQHTLRHKGPHWCRSTWRTEGQPSLPHGLRKGRWEMQIHSSETTDWWVISACYQSFANLMLGPLSLSLYISWQEHWSFGRKFFPWTCQYSTVHLFQLNVRLLLLLCRNNGRPCRVADGTQGQHWGQHWGQAPGSS